MSMTTKELTKGYRFGAERDVTDPLDKTTLLNKKILQLVSLDDPKYLEEDWVEVMAWFGSRGDRLTYLDYKLPMPVGKSLEDMLEDRKYIGIAHSYILGFSSYTRNSYKNYIDATKCEEMPKSLIDVRKERFRENEKYLKENKARYLINEARRKSTLEILEQDNTDDI